MSVLHSVRLTDDELVLLDGKVADKAQSEVNAAKRRISQRADYLAVAQSDLIATMLQKVDEYGELRWINKPLSACRLCGRDDGYRLFKSGQRKGQPDYKHRKTFAGIDMDPSFVSIQHTAFLGGCLACMADLLPHLRTALDGVPVDAPASLLGPDSPRWKKRRNRTCKSCGWTGHEGQMIQERTLMGDGWYPARCPECKAGGGFSRGIEHGDGFVLEPVPATP